MDTRDDNETLKRQVRRETKIQLSVQHFHPEMTVGLRAKELVKLKQCKLPLKSIKECTRMGKIKIEDNWNKINVYKLFQLNTHLRHRIIVHGI
jgi:hypothetical protein